MTRIKRNSGPRLNVYPRDLVMAFVVGFFCGLAMFIAIQVMMGS